MRNGMRCLLAVLAATLAVPTIRAGDDVTQIKLEVKIVRVDDACFERVRDLCAAKATKSCCDSCPDGKCCPETAATPCCKSCPDSTCCVKTAAAPAQRFLPSTLSAAQVARLMEFIQGDMHSSILSSPKITTLNGQCANVQIGAQQMFVTDVCSKNCNGVPVFVPNSEAFATGVRFDVRPTATPDRKSIIMKLNTEITDIDSGSPALFPVTTTITPIFEGGAQGQPIPFTQFVQQPSLTTRGVQKVAGVRCGETALIYAGRRTSVEETCSEVPVLCDLPVIGELFRSKSCNVANDHLLVLVTPCIVDSDLVLAEQPPIGPIPPCFDLPIMCEEALTQASYRSEECIPVAPKPVCATAACAAQCPAQCPQAVQARNATGVWTAAACPAACPCPGTCPCPTACPCPAPTACPTPVATAGCPLTSPAYGPPCTSAAHCAFVLVPVHQFAWTPTQIPVHAYPQHGYSISTMPVHAVAACGVPVPKPVAMPASVSVRLVAGEEQSARTPANPQLARMLRKYQQACEDGDTEKARKLAGKCLLIDPTCFAK